MKRKGKLTGKSWGTPAAGQRPPAPVVVGLLRMLHIARHGGRGAWGWQTATRQRQSVVWSVLFCSCSGLVLFLSARSGKKLRMKKMGMMR